MDEFPNNSQRARSGSDIPKEEEIQIEKIISGEAVIQKPSGFKRLRRSFIAGDASSVGEHVFWNLLIPSAKDALSDMGSTFIDMMIYGEKRNRVPRHIPQQGVGSNSRINYGNISTSGSRLVLGPSQSIHEPEQPRFTPNDIVVGTRAEAEGIITKMFEVLDRYGLVTVANLYSMLGVTTNPMDSKWGWVNLSDSNVKRVSNGYLLVLPVPTDLGN